jgi:enoyl-CoA hydratase/carnithine racemase
MVSIGDMIGAREAERLGLLNRVVPGDRLEDSVEEVQAFLGKRTPTWKER